MLRSNKKIGGCICIRRVSSSNGFKFRQELTAVQIKMYVTPPLTDASGPQFFKYPKNNGNNGSRFFWRSCTYARLDCSLKMQSHISLYAIPYFRKIILFWSSAANKSLPVKYLSNVFFLYYLTVPLTTLLPRYCSTEVVREGS